MPIVEDFGFCGPTYAGLPSGVGGMSTVFDAERCVNLYPERAQRTGNPKSSMALVGRPGYSLFATVNSPIRAIWGGNNRLFAVGGTHFYEFNTNGTVHTDYGAMAGSSGIGPCQVMSNGNQLLVMDPSVTHGGSINGSIFNANPGGPNMVSVFNGGALAFMDGFYIAINSSSGLSYPNQVNVSNLLDGTTWNSLNFIQRTGAADLLWQLETLQGQLWMFGQKSIEVWYDAGNPTFPFARIQGATINLGLLAQFSVVKFYNTLCWLGADDHGYAAVYMASGLSPVKISTPAVEYILNNAGQQSAQTGTTAYGYEEGGHMFYCLNLSYAPNYNGTQGTTLVYDLTEGLWHERNYLTPGTGVVTQHRANCVACVPDFAANGGIFIGDYNSGNIYVQNLGFTADNSNPILYKRRAPHVANRNRWVKYPSLELDCDIGSAQAVLSYSNDGGRTFTHSRAAQGTVTPSGNSDQIPKLKWWQLGRSRDRVFDVTITDSSHPIRLVNAYLNAVPGTEP